MFHFGCMKPCCIGWHLVYITYIIYDNICFYWFSCSAADILHRPFQIVDFSSAKCAYFAAKSALRSRDANKKTSGHGMLIFGQNRDHHVHSGGENRCRCKPTDRTGSSSPQLLTCPRARVRGNYPGFTPLVECEFCSGIFFLATK
jgi:hypothetical protein